MIKITFVLALVALSACAPHEPPKPYPLFKGATGNVVLDGVVTHTLPQTIPGQTKDVDVETEDWSGKSTPREEHKKTNQNAYTFACTKNSVDANGIVKCETQSMRPTFKPVYIKRIYNGGSPSSNWNAPDATDALKTVEKCEKEATYKLLPSGDEKKLCLKSKMYQTHEKCITHKWETYKNGRSLFVCVKTKLFLAADGFWPGCKSQVFSATVNFVNGRGKVETAKISTEIPYMYAIIGSGNLDQEKVAGLTDFPKAPTGFKFKEFTDAQLVCDPKL